MVKNNFVFIDVFSFVTKIVISYLYFFFVETNYEIKMEFIFVIVFSVLFDHTNGANMACQEVRYAYSAKGMNVYDVPLKPQSGKI